MEAQEERSGQKMLPFWQKTAQKKAARNLYFAAAFFMFERCVVGLSNILDEEVNGRREIESPHRKVVGAAVMQGKLLVKVKQGEKGVGIIEAFLVFPVAALHLAIMSGCVGADQFMLDAQLSSGFLKKGRDIPFAVREAVSKFKAVVRLDTFHPDSPAGVPFHQALEEVSGGIGGLLWIGGQKAEPGELINGSVLEQAQLRIGNAAARDYLHIYLDPLPRISHLLIRFWNISLFLLLLRKHAQLTHDTKQTLGPAGITSLFEAVPQFHQTQGRIAAAHIPDELQFCFCVLVWMAVGTPGLAGQGLHTSIPASPPEVDIGPALVVLSAGTAHAIFLRVFH